MIFRIVAMLLLSTVVQSFTFKYSGNRVISGHNGHKNRFPSSKPTFLIESDTVEYKTLEEKEDAIIYKDAITKTLACVLLAGIFAGGISMNMGSTSAIEFLSGYVLEQSLSIDNLFVFLVLFDYFKVNKVLQKRVLNYGIYGGVNVFIFPYK